MKTKSNVLISAAGGSFFPYVFSALSDEFVIHAVDANPVIKKIYPKQNVHILPKVSDQSYSEAIRSLLKKQHIDFYVPLIDEEIPLAHTIAKTIEGLKVIAPKSAFVDLCLDKQKLMERLSQEGISSIPTVRGDDVSFEKLSYPVFVKPIVGRGSRGSRKISNKEELAAYFLFESYSQKEVIIQSLLIGQEYTVSVVVNNTNKLIAIVPKKVIEKKGVTIQAVTEKNRAISKVCKQIVDTFKPEGPFNVQLILINKVPFIFEINPRFSTTTILSCEAGVNEFELCMKNYDVLSPEFVDFKEGVHLHRRWESCFYEK